MTLLSLPAPGGSAGSVSADAGAAGIRRDAAENQPDRSADLREAKAPPGWGGGSPGTLARLLTTHLLVPTFPGCGTQLSGFLCLRTVHTPFKANIHIFVCFNHIMNKCLNKFPCVKVFLWKHKDCSELIEM